MDATFSFVQNDMLDVPEAVQERLYHGVYDLFGVPQDQLASADRTRTPSLARHAAALALRHWDRTITLTQLAAAIYRRDHTTASYALEHGQEEYDKIITFRVRVDVLKARVGLRGMTEAPAENTVDELTYLRSEVERLKNQNIQLAQVLADLQSRLAFVNIQLLPAMVREQEVGGHS